MQSRIYRVYDNLSSIFVPKPSFYVQVEIKCWLVSSLVCVLCPPIKVQSLCSLWSQPIVRRTGELSTAIILFCCTSKNENKWVGHNLPVKLSAFNFCFWETKINLAEFCILNLKGFVWPQFQKPRRDVRVFWTNFEPAQGV